MLHVSSKCGMSSVSCVQYIPVLRKFSASSMLMKNEQRVYVQVISRSTVLLAIANQECGTLIQLWSPSIVTFLYSPLAFALVSP